MGQRPGQSCERTESWDLQELQDCGEGKSSIPFRGFQRLQSSALRSSQHEPDQFEFRSRRSGSNEQRPADPDGAEGVFLGLSLAWQILHAAHFAGRCRISARACNRFESAALLVDRALSFSDRAKPWSFTRSLRFRCELQQRLNNPARTVSKAFFTL